MIIETLNLYFHIQCFRVCIQPSPLSVQCHGVLWHRSGLRHTYWKPWWPLLMGPALPRAQSVCGVRPSGGSSQLPRVPLFPWGVSLERAKQVCAMCLCETGFVAEEQLFWQEAETATLGGQ